MRTGKLLMAISAMLFFGCGPEKEAVQAEKKYFDLRGFIDNQKVALQNNKAAIHKIVILDGVKDEMDFKNPN